jgi:hypothetical protein
MNRSLRAGLAALGLVAGGIGAGATLANATSPAPAAVVEPGTESHFVPINAYRTLDTREDGNPIDVDDNEADMVAVGDPDGENPLPVPATLALGEDGDQIPEEATAVTFNVTVTSTQGAGFVQVDTSPADPGATSTVNWTAAGQTDANSGVVMLGEAFDDTGFISVYVGGTDDAAAHVIVDITGYYVDAPIEAPAT